jgi:hypothetical protein
MAEARQFGHLMGLDFLCKVIKTKGMFTVVLLSAGDRRVADISLTPITSKARFSNPSEMSSVGVESGRCAIAAFKGFWDLGYKEKYGKLLLSK